MIDELLHFLTDRTVKDMLDMLLGIQADVTQIQIVIQDLNTSYLLSFLMLHVFARHLLVNVLGADFR